MNQSTIMCDSNTSIRSTGPTISIKKPAKKSQKSTPAKAVLHAEPNTEKLFI